MIKTAKKIVIKIGSSTIYDFSKNHQDIFKSLISDIKELKSKGKDIAIVSSGAVAFGRSLINDSAEKLSIEEKQASAAIGQPILINEYNSRFQEQGMNTAQILLTTSDIQNRRRFLNAKNTFEKLFEKNIIPIVNENDTVATEELKFGDNDRLSAYVAQLIGADLLIILSDVHGLYENFGTEKQTLIETVDEVNESIIKIAGGSGSKVGTGGMITKIEAAKVAADSGCQTIIAFGKRNNPLISLTKDKHDFTLFTSKQSPLAARKAQIAERFITSGYVTIDEGAEKALKDNKSLLAVGVKKVFGQFSRGDKIAVHNIQGQEIAFGITAYGNKDLQSITGKKSSEIEPILGYSGRDAVIHKDDLVLL